MSEKKELQLELEKDSQNNLELGKLLKELSDLEKKLGGDGILGSGDSRIDNNYLLYYKDYKDKEREKIVFIRQILETEKNFLEEYNNIKSIIDKGKKEGKKIQEILKGNDKISKWMIYEYVNHPSTDKNDILDILSYFYDNVDEYDINGDIIDNRKLLEDEEFCIRLLHISPSNIKYIENTKLIIDLCNGRKPNSLKGLNIINYDSDISLNRLAQPYGLEFVNKLVDESSAEDLSGLYQHIGNFSWFINYSKDNGVNTDILNKIQKKIEDKGVPKNGDALYGLYNKLAEKKLNSNELLNSYKNLDEIIEKGSKKDLINIINGIINNGLTDDENIYKNITNKIKNKLDIDNSTKNLILLLKNPEDKEIAQKIQSHIIEEIGKGNFRVNCLLLSKSNSKFNIDKSKIEEGLNNLKNLLLKTNNVWQKGNDNDLNDLYILLNGLKNSNYIDNNLKEKLDDVINLVDELKEFKNKIGTFKNKIKNFVEADDNKKYFIDGFPSDEIIEKINKVKDGDLPSLYKILESQIKGENDKKDKIFLQIFELVINETKDKIRIGINRELFLYNKEENLKKLEGKGIIYREKTEDTEEEVFTFSREAIDLIRKKIQKEIDKNEKSIDEIKIISDFLKENGINDPNNNIAELLKNEISVIKNEVIASNPEAIKALVSGNYEEYNKLSQKIEKEWYNGEMNKNSNQIKIEENTNNIITKKDESGNIIFSQKIGEKIVEIKENELNETEKKDLNKEKLKKIINFKLFLEDMGLDFLWEYRKELSIDMKNRGFTKFDYLDSDSLGEQEQLDLLNFLAGFLKIDKSNDLKILSENFRDFSKLSVFEANGKKYEKSKKSIFEQLLEGKLIENGVYKL